jgi:hypothetical protein
MAQDTRRDRVWSTVLEAFIDGVDHDLPERVGVSNIPDGLIKSDITPRVEASGRTVHDVLQTMTEYGYLESETQRVYVPTPTGHERQETAVYTPAPAGPLAAFADTELADETDTADAAEPRSEPEHPTTDDEPRYVIGCPECEYKATRRQDSAAVKGVRRRERVCPECEARLELLKDDRPDPPVCPKCSEEAIAVKEATDEGVRYVHGYNMIDAGIAEMREVEGCMVR